MKTNKEKETEAILTMVRTIEQLTMQVSFLQEKIRILEASRIYPTYPNAPTPYTPWYPPYTITSTTVNGIKQ